MRRVLIVALLWLAVPATAAAAPALDPHAPIDVAGQRIAVEELIHWQRIAALSSGTDRRGHLHWRARVWREQVASLLISYRWLDLEAARLGIVVTREEVVASYRAQRHASFPHGGYARFLRTTGQTRADIRNRVRLDLLSQRLQDRALAGVAREDQDRALGRYIREFRRRWRAVTTCRPEYASRDSHECGTVTL